MKMKIGKVWAISLVAITVSACASATPYTVVDQRRTAVVVGTVNQSEWCPAGNVRVDLETGDYAYTAGAPRAVCQDLDLERPIVKGQLNASQVRVLDQAFQRAITDGLNACRAGQRPKDFIFSNGGLAVLVVNNGRAMDAAPSDLSCWTEAAWALHNLLQATFPEPR